MILKNEKGTVNFGLFVIFLLVGVFGIWLGMAPLNSAAVAVGKIGVVSNKKIIQHLEGGVVDKIFVKDKSIVEKIENFLKEKSYALMEYPHYEDIYFDKKASGELTIYGYEKRVFQKAFLGINDEIDAYIKTHMWMRGIKFSIIKM